MLTMKLRLQEAKDAKRFDRAFFGHMGHIVRTKLRVILLTLTQGGLTPYYGGFLSPYKRRLAWTSAIFALIADISMIYFGGALKAKQKITGRLGDILSWMYLATCTMVYYEKHRDNKDLKPIVEWALIIASTTFKLHSSVTSRTLPGSHAC